MIIQGGDQIERRTLGVRLQVLHVHTDPRPTHPTHGAQHANAIAQVNQPQQRERKVLGGEQLHLQSEGEDVWVCGRQQAVVGKTADLAIGRQTFRIDIHPAAQARGRQGGAGDFPTRCRVCIQPRQAGFAIECVPVDSHA
ncbi:hypothetical protein D3C87_1596960 [compost metagenome]